MPRDEPKLKIWATKPQGSLAASLIAMGIEVLPIDVDEGNIDRYIISERLAVERRTANTFLRGILDKTLFTSATALRESYEIAVLIVEGENDYRYTSFNPQAVRGALSSMVLVYGISVLSTDDLEESASLIAMMTRQEQAGVPEISLVPKRKVADLADIQRRMVEMLPGCGLALARQLLQHLGGIDQIVNASQAELAQVRGIGPAKAQEIHRVLHAEYKAVDAERDLEDAVAARPQLLFERPATLVARQHQIHTEHSRLVIDLVFWDAQANELILVELKRDTLTSEHQEQLGRYLNHARASDLLRAYLDRGATLRGVLASVESSLLCPQDPRIAIRIIDRAEAIQILGELRNSRRRERT